MDTKPSVTVYIKPDTIWQHLNLLLRGRCPFITCDEIRYGAGMIECIKHDENKCWSFQVNRVQLVFWDGGFKEALKKVRDLYVDNLQNMYGPGSTEPENKPEDLASKDAYR